MSKEAMYENGKKLSPGQIAYRKALARKAALAQPAVVELTQAKAAAVQKAAKRVVAKTAVAKPVIATHCNVCGKPLTRVTSMEAGIGDICASKMKLLPVGTTMADHYALLQEVDVPEDFMLLKEAVQAAREKGCSGYRFIQACGGDRVLRSPFNANFRVVFVLGKRYVSRQSLKDLALLVKI